MGARPERGGVVLPHSEFCDVRDGGVVEIARAGEPRVGHSSPALMRGTKLGRPWVAPHVILLIILS